MEKKAYKEVFVLTEKDGRTWYTKVGVAFENKDGSTNMYLDALPLSGKLQMREPKPKTELAQAPRNFEFPPHTAEAA